MGQNLPKQVDADVWLQAATLMRSALSMLDAIDAPAEISGHLDLAIARLERETSAGGISSGT